MLLQEDCGGLRSKMDTWSLRVHEEKETLGVRRTMIRLSLENVHAMYAKINFPILRATSDSAGLVKAR